MDLMPPQSSQSDLDPPAPEIIVTERQYEPSFGPEIVNADITDISINNMDNFV